MNLRHLLLKIMLGSLAVGAVVGALAMLVAPYSATWRIVGTCFVTAVAATLLLGASVLADKPKARAAGMLGMAGVLLEFLGAVLLIWDFARALGVSQLDDHIALTMGLLAPVVLVAMALLRAVHVKITQMAARAGVWLCKTEAVLLLIAIWGPENIDDEMLATAGIFAGFAAVTVVSLVGVGTVSGWRRLLPWAGSILSAIALIIGVIAIWQHLQRGEGAYTVLVTVTVFVGFANAVLAIPLPPSQRWVRTVTLIAAAVTGAGLDAAIIAEHGEVADLARRVGAAAGIIGSCGTLALAVLARLNRRTEVTPTTLTEIKQITLACPVCQKRQTVDLGESRCASCGLILQVRVEEPRCPTCGYILLMNRSDLCPECGTKCGARVLPDLSAPGAIEAPLSSN